MKKITFLIFAFMTFDSFSMLILSANAGGGKRVEVIKRDVGFTITKYKSNGTLDENFGVEGEQKFNDDTALPTSVNVDLEGNIIVHGQNGFYAKFDRNGSLISSSSTTDF